MNMLKTTNKPLLELVNNQKLDIINPQLICGLIDEENKGLFGF